MKAMHIIQQELGKAGAMSKFVFEHLRPDFHGIAGNLHNSAAKNLVFTQGGWSPHETFLSHDSILDGLSLRVNADRRCHSTVHEVRIIDPIVCVVQDPTLS